MIRLICLMLMLSVGCTLTHAQTPQEEKCNQLLSVGQSLHARIEKLEKEQLATEDEMDAKIIGLERGLMIRVYDNLREEYVKGCMI